ncbi:hypothetical protein [Sphingomonas sp. OTU376]|uniref:hypothetical protein n=1 Tax=Sphingomonas sp. OTU376 TaxID=3043863 RepID=UPI00313E2774
MLLAAAVACIALGYVPVASAQTSDSDLLAPLVDPDADLIAPLTDPDADLLAPLVPQNAFEEDLLAPLVPPGANSGGKDMSEEELIEKGAATIRDPNTARDALARSLQWADREIAKTLKKIPKEDMKGAMEAIRKMDGMTDMRTPQPRPGKKPLPLEIDMAEQMEWQRKQEASNGTMVLVESPMEVTQCGSGVCSTRLKMHYELQPVSGTAPNN